MLDLESIDPNVQLHPDLEAYVEELDMFNTLRHPLVYSVPFFNDPYSITRCNMQYEVKKKEIEKAKKEKEWARYIYLHEKPYWISVLMDINEELDEKLFWSLFIESWSIVENIYATRVFWFHLIHSRKKPSLDLVMDESEIEFFNSLPDEFEIYRGTTADEPHDTDSLSWTTDREKAEWFADRRESLTIPPVKTKVLSRVVKKEQVLVYHNGRYEHEIIIYPQK